MYCAKCGKEMDDSAKFCPACGADASGDASSVQADPAPSYSSSNSVAAEETQSSGSGVGAMVCGIIGLIFCWIPFVNIIGLILGIIAIVLGSSGRKTLPPSKRGMATAGFVLGIISLIFSVVWLLVVIILIATFGAVVGSLGSMFGWL